MLRGKLIILRLCLTSILLAACGELARQPLAYSEAELLAEEHLVYQSIIPYSQQRHRRDYGEVILIKAETVSGGGGMALQSYEGRLPQLDAAIRASFVAAGGNARPLTRELSLHQPYELTEGVLGQESAEALSAEWERFYRRYPRSRGYIELSRVAFNQTFDQALVYMGYLCGDTCGNGELHLLRKQHGQWFVEESVITWVS